MVSKKHVTAQTDMVKTIHTDLYSDVAAEIVEKAIIFYHIKKPSPRSFQLCSWRDVNGEVCILAGDKYRRSSWDSSTPTQIRKFVASLVGDLSTIWKSVPTHDPVKVEIVHDILFGKRHYDVCFHKEAIDETVGVPKDPIAAEVERECRDELDKFDAETKILMNVMSSAKSFDLTRADCLIAAYAFELERNKKRKELLETLAHLRKAVS